MRILFYYHYYIKMDLHINTNNNYYFVTLNFNNSDIKSITIEEPYDLNHSVLEEINNLTEKYTCILDGGGNSCWTLFLKDGIYTMTSSISGMGYGSEITVVLPTDQIVAHLKNIFQLDSAYKTGGIRGVEEAAKQLENVNIIKD